MKKISLLTATVLCISTITSNARRFSEEHTLGQQVIRELGENVKTANLIFRASVGEIERQEALKNAHMAAQTLLNTLNDIKTYGNDTIKGYNAAQRRQAAITLAELLTRENSLNIEIKNKKMEIMDMMDMGYVFDAPKPGKSEIYAQARNEKKDLYATLKEVNLAIKNQEIILGDDWTRTIKLAVQNLILGSSYGIAYGIDWYFGDRGAKLLTENNPSQSMAPGTRKGKIKQSTPLTKKQKAAIKSWNHLRKAELLSKEIITAYQLTQAKELLNKLGIIKKDLKDVPLKQKYILDRVTDNYDSLERKIDRSKTRWLK
jgi:hypothetical protein